MKKFLIILFCAVSMICVCSSSNAFGEKVFIVSFEGDAKITPTGAVAPVPCEKDMLLEEGTRIATGKGAYVRIAFNEAKNNIVEVRENSDVVLKLDGADKIELVNGEVFNVLKGLKHLEEFRVRTPNAVCAARGSVQDIRFNPDDNITNVAAIEEPLYLTLLGKGFVIEQGFMAIVKDDAIERIERLSEALMMEYKKQASGIMEEVKEPEKEEEKKAAPGGPGGPGDSGGGGISGGKLSDATSRWADSMLAQIQTDFIFMPGITKSPITQTDDGNPANQRDNNRASAIEDSEHSEIKVIPVP